MGLRDRGTISFLTRVVLGLVTIAGACGSGTQTSGKELASGSNAAASAASAAAGGSAIARDAAAPVVAPGGSGVGRVNVRVAWPAAPAAARATGPRNACGVARRAGATIGTLHGVAGALVMIEDVVAPAGAAASAPAAPVMLRVRDCRVEPAVALVPDGGGFAIANDDARRHRIAIGDAGAPRDAQTWPAPVARGAIDLGWAGAAVVLDGARARVWRLATEAAPDDGAWVVFAGSLAAISDATGAVSFADLPAGRHHIYVWLPERGDGTHAHSTAADFDVVAGADTELTLGFGSP